MSRYASICIIMAGMILGGVSGLAFAAESHSVGGTIGTDKSVYEVERHEEQYMTIYGESTKSYRQEIDIIIEFPDQTITNISIKSRDDGGFDVPFRLDYVTALDGTYSVTGSSESGPLGQVNFQVRNQDKELFERPSDLPITLTVDTDKPSYVKGSIITISGMMEITDASMDKKIPVALKIFESDQLLKIISVITNDDGEFSTNIDTGKAIWMVNKTYTIKADFEDHTAQTTFSLTTEKPVPIPTNDLPKEPVPTPTNDLPKEPIPTPTNNLPEPVPIPTAPESTSARILYYYTEPLPDWADYATNVMQVSTQVWTDANPGIEFRRAENPTDADFRVQWVKEFAGERVGYAYGDKLIEVGLGDSHCLDVWQPYSANHVSDIMKHEIGHILGLGHSENPNDIMYSIALNKEYGLITHEETLTNNYAYFHPICTVKDVTSFYYHVSTDDPVYGFDVYFVPSRQSLTEWGDGEPFSYYSDESCYGKNYKKYGNTCSGVARESGILVVMGDVQTNSLTKVTISLEEKSQNPVSEKIQAEPDQPRPDGPIPHPIPQLGIPDWFKNTASWWSDDIISDDTFVSGLVFMINDNIIKSGLEQSVIYDGTSVPDWLKYDAKRWADNEMADDEFLNSMLRFVDLRLNNTETDHKHASILVKIHGEKLDFSDLQNKDDLIYFEQDGATIHMHKPGATIGYFFETLGVEISEECYVTPDELKFCTNDGFSLKYHVNGWVEQDLSDYIMDDDDRILVTYGDESYGVIEEYVAELDAQPIRADS